MTRRISNPYEKIAHKTERTNNQKLVQWMNEIIQEKRLNLGDRCIEDAGNQYIQMLIDIERGK